MANLDNEQLRLNSPEYAAALTDITSLSASFMDSNPDYIDYHRNASYLYLKTPSCGENEYYQLSRGLPFPYPQDPDWSVIDPHVSRVEIRDGGLSNTTTTYTEKEGILISSVYVADNNENDGAPSLIKELSIEDVQHLMQEINEGIPYKVEPLSETITLIEQLRTFFGMDDPRDYANRLRETLARIREYHKQQDEASRRNRE